MEADSRETFKKMNQSNTVAQIIKLAAGDELARIAKTTEPILGTAHKGVGEMITENLAESLAGMINHIKGKVLEVGKTDPDELSRQWVAWRSKKAVAKAAADAVEKAAADAKKQKAEAAQKVKEDANAAKADKETTEAAQKVKEDADAEEAAGGTVASDAKRESDTSGPQPAEEVDVADANPESIPSGPPAGSSAAGPG